MSKVKDKKKSSDKEIEKSEQKINANNYKEEDVVSGLLKKINNKMDDAWKEWNTNFQSVLSQGISTAKQNVQSSVIKQQIKKPKMARLKVKVDISKLKEQPRIQSKLTTEEERKQLKQETHARFKVRAKSQNQTQLKSLKKTNQLISQKEEEQKKTLRLKEITKRKLQLMERLKKIDVELLQAKREASPTFEKTGDKSLYQSNINRSFIANISNSRINKPVNQNVVEQHFKAVEMLQKINNEKIKRQQKIAEQFRKKQQEELNKINELQKKRALQLQQRNRKNELAVSKMLKNRKPKAKVNNAKPSQLLDLPTNESSVIPMTLVQKSKSYKKNNDDDIFLDKLPQKSTNNLLTDRDYEEDAQIHAKQFENAIIEDKQQTQLQQEHQGQKNQENQEYVNPSASEEVNQQKQLIQQQNQNGQLEQSQVEGQVKIQ